MVGQWGFIQLNPTYSGLKHSCCCCCCHCTYWFVREYMQQSIQDWGERGYASIIYLWQWCRWQNVVEELSFYNNGPGWTWMERHGYWGQLAWDWVVVFDVFFFLSFRQPVEWSCRVIDPKIVLRLLVWDSDGSNLLVWHARLQRQQQQQRSTTSGVREGRMYADLTLSLWGREALQYTQWNLTGKVR